MTTPDGAQDRVPARPFPLGTVVRCKRPTPWGEDVVHGVVIDWHNTAGWLVEGADSGIVASPGAAEFIDRTVDLEWTFEPIGEVPDGS